MPLTHTIAGAKVLRYLPHHHRRTPTGRVHAVNGLDGEIRDGRTVQTVCGATVGILEYPEVYTPTYNCRPCTDVSRVTCKDCKKAL